MIVVRWEAWTYQLSIGAIWQLSDDPYHTELVSCHGPELRIVLSFLTFPHLYNMLLFWPPFEWMKVWIRISEWYLTSKQTFALPAICSETRDNLLLLCTTGWFILIDQKFELTIQARIHAGIRERCDERSVPPMSDTDTAIPEENWYQLLVLLWI